MEFLMHFLKGYVRIWVYGYSPERFLNLCANRGIFLWNIEKQEEGYTLCLHKKAFFALKPIVKKPRYVYCIDTDCLSYFREFEGDGYLLQDCF